MTTELEMCALRARYKLLMRRRCFKEAQSVLRQIQRSVIEELRRK